MADTVETGFAVAAADIAIGEVGNGLRAFIDEDTAYAGVEHGVEAGLTVRIVTAGTVEAGGAATGGGKVSRHAANGSVTGVTKGVALAIGFVIEATDDLETVGVSSHATDVGGGFVVTIGTGAVWCSTSGQTVTDVIVSGSGAARRGDATDHSVSVIAVTGFTADAVKGRPFELGQIGSDAATVTGIAAIDGVNRVIDRTVGNFEGRSAINEGNGAVDVGGLASHAGVIGSGVMTGATVSIQFRAIAADGGT